LDQEQQVILVQTKCFENNTIYSTQKNYDKQ